MTKYISGFFRTLLAMLLCSVGYIIAVFISSDMPKPVSVLSIIRCILSIIICIAVPILSG